MRIEKLKLALYFSFAAIGIVDLCGISPVYAVLQWYLIACGGVLVTHVGDPLLILGDGTGLVGEANIFWEF